MYDICLHSVWRTDGWCNEFDGMVMCVGGVKCLSMVYTGSGGICCHNGLIIRIVKQSIEGMVVDAGWGFVDGSNGMAVSASGGFVDGIDDLTVGIGQWKCHGGIRNF